MYFVVLFSITVVILQIVIVENKLPGDSKGSTPFHRTRLLNVKYE